MNDSTTNTLISKFYVGIFVAVIALHAITGMALANIKAPEMVIDEPVEPEPLEIEIIRPIIETPAEVIESVPLPKPVTQSKPQLATTETPSPRPEPTPKTEPKPKPKPKVKAKLESQPKNIKPLNTQSDQESQAQKLAEQQAVLKKQQQAKLAIQKQADLSAQEQARLRAQEQARENAQEQARLKAQEESRQKAEAEAKLKSQEEARQKAEADAKLKAQEEARQKAEADAKLKAQEEAIQRAKEFTNSNTPQQFSANEASWRRKPKFSFPDSVNRTARSGQVFVVSMKLRVDKQGNIDSVTLVSSSGNRAIDKAATDAVKKAKFNPFTSQGVPVIGLLNLPIEYKVP